MPRRPDPAAATDRIPGFRRWLIEREQRDQAQLDPRVYLSPGSAAEQVAAIRPPSGMLADLKADAPVVIPAWKLRGRRFGHLAQRIPWLADATFVVVHADDSITIG